MRHGLAACVLVPCVALGCAHAERKALSGPLRERGPVVRLELRDGAFVRGTLVGGAPDQTLLLRVADGRVRTFETDDVRTMHLGAGGPPERDELELHDGTLVLGLILSVEPDGAFIVALGNEQHRVARETVSSVRRSNGAAVPEPLAEPRRAPAPPRAVGHAAQARLAVLVDSKPYGDRTALADFAALGATALALATFRPAALVVLPVGYLGGPAWVHLRHGSPRAVRSSLAFRLGLPAAGALAGLLAGREKGAAGGAALGGFAAILIDAFFVSRTEPLLGTPPDGFTYAPAR